MHYVFHNYYRVIVTPINLYIYCVLVCVYVFMYVNIFLTVILPQTAEFTKICPNSSLLYIS